MLHLHIQHLSLESGLPRDDRNDSYIFVLILILNYLGKILVLKVNREIVGFVEKYYQSFQALEDLHLVRSLSRQLHTDSQYHQMEL